ncbi:ArsR/SmtB family transcription factor [Mucilaginibacter sp. FT3.2]|uniref:ArsR/SmtB family transcription factor n=1 Tax=Mucilaginibacter sp. FT3.2 TaxID=2723090 RepID=UPI0016131424|nr:metalloregulator ArsR/SmtB family transcription factor [Mucilaginibacter sp. FT3.2]MBB6235018.1 DNA-binding transcriptional ArsR family regulator [Mucilaginibacter sp. FT3.2]
MGLTKTENFTEAQNELAKMLKAIAHPARIAIIEHLIQANACIGNDLVEVLGLAQPTISQHLRELKEAGIIKGTIDGTSMNYCIDQANWKKYADKLNAFFVTLKFPENCC